MSPARFDAAPKTGKSLLMEGLTDALGFLVGASLGWWLAALLGFEVATEGYGVSRMVGVALVILGGSLGLKQARRLRRAHLEKKFKEKNDSA